MSNDIILAAEHISHTYNGSKMRIRALDETSIELSRESFVCVVGPSGCGKSTLLRILGGLLAPTEGRVLLEAQPIKRAQRRIGIVFQNTNLMPWRTVYQNITLPLELAGLSRDEIDQRTRAMLDLIALQHFAGTYPAALSGGMAQRVAIGRALIHDPEVLLLDEPFGALDALTREHMSEELLRIWSRHRKTVLMVTHSIPEAVLLADRVLVFSPRPGRLLADLPIPLDRPRSLKQMHQPAFTALTEQLRDAIRPA